MESSLFNYKPPKVKPTPRILHFTQITENEQELKDRVHLIIHKLHELPNIEVNVDRFRKVVFGEPEPCIQWRIEMYVKKDSKTTWESVMHIVNSVKPAPYDFVKSI